MSKYAAQIENSIVTQVIVGDSAWANDRLNGAWVGSDEKVGIGWTYNENDGFRPPQPYPSWTWADGWQPPVPYPDGEGFYTWDENGQAWVAVEEGS